MDNGGEQGDVNFIYKAWLCTLNAEDHAFGNHAHIQDAWDILRTRIQTGAIYMTGIDTKHRKIVKCN